MADQINFTPLRALDSNGLPVAAAQALFYISGTSTLQTVYADAAGTVPHPQPLIADARGLFAQVYSSINIKVSVSSPSGTILPGFPIDPAYRTAISGSGAFAISFSPTVEIPVTDVQSAIERVQANIGVSGLTITATAAGTTTLVEASTVGQRFTGTTTQTVVLPVVTTLALGRKFEIENASTGALTVNSSGGNLVATIPAGATAMIKCILASGTTAASWSALTLAPMLPGRNLIINGSGRMNQRSYVSGAATSGANEFTLDRWFVITSGQNLSFTGDASARVMTAPAGGVAQVIEGADIVGGTYVLNWVGTATATVGGTARTKGETFTLTANTNAKVIFSSGTFSNVQLEAGTVTTPFEVVSFGDLLAKCQRYFEFSQFILASSAFGGGISVNTGQWSVKKRATPTLTLFPASGTGATITALGIHAYYQSATHSAVVTGTVQADAELTA